ncbi:MAG: metallophosphoesterase [Actinobacteria bacterium]|nr:metallophosphoesterase [Actinomycetota bacterium]
MTSRRRTASALLTATLAVAIALPLGLANPSSAAEGSLPRPADTTPAARVTAKLPQAGAVVAAFSLAAPSGATASGLVARAIIAAGTRCPALTTVSIDGTTHSTPMRQRVPAATTAQLFGALISCSAPMPAKSVSARVLSTTIPNAMPARITRMAVLGDTGCRIKGAAIQACNDPAAWPLATLSATIAAQRPDLTVFLGDFFYREALCPPEQTAACGGSPAPGAVPFKDSALGWNADTFIPMAPLLAAAPLVVVRGNHEDCPRGGNGYFIYMDPREGTEGTCAPAETPAGELVKPAPDLTSPYAIDVKVSKGKDLRFIIMDSAAGWDCGVTPLLPKQTAAYASARKLAKGSDQYWLLVHRPIAAWTPTDDCTEGGSWVAADQQIASYGQLAPYDLILSSHVHLVESMNIPGIPGQLILGNGSTQLEVEKPFVLPTAGPAWDPAKTYPAPTSGWWAVRFGYAMAHPGKASTWTMKLRAPDGAEFARCRVVKRLVNCR